LARKTCREKFLEKALNEKEFSVRIGVPWLFLLISLSAGESYESILTDPKMKITVLEN
jgi:hypothetical protein